MRGGSANLQDGRAVLSIFSRRDFAIGNGGFQRRFRRQQVGICRAGIAKYSNMILQLYFIGIANLQNRRILDFNLDDGNVFAFSNWSTKSLNLKRIDTAIGKNDIMNVISDLDLYFIGNGRNVVSCEGSTLLLICLLYQLNE